MIRILNYAGTQPSLPLDRTGFTGDIDKDARLSVVTKMVSGRVCALGHSGATLADGDDDKGLIPLGFIVQNAYARRWQNKATLASKKIGYVPLTGGVVVETDQFVTGEIFSQGDYAFCGTGDNAGLVTKDNAVGNDGTAASVDLFSSEVTVALNFRGAIGNDYSIVITDDETDQEDGVPVMTSDASDRDIKIVITSGTTTQSQLKDLLETHDDISSVIVGSAAGVLTIVGDDESGDFSGGVDGNDKPIGIVEGEADESNPFLRIHVVGSGL